MFNVKHQVREFMNWDGATTADAPYVFGESSTKGSNFDELTGVTCVEYILASFLFAANCIVKVTRIFPAVI